MRYGHKRKHYKTQKPKKPNGTGWRKVKQRIPQMDDMGYPYEIWAHDENGLGVISAVEVAHDPGQPDLGPEYHVSVSAFGGRCSSSDALWVCGQFDMIDSDEDNHAPHGKVRNFWKPVDENLIGHVCPCKETEPAMKENKGDYIWRGINS